ncbi:hypothetical protein BMS3Bbin13_00160 [bacterium BMS3Bbin13]|nr:hypothetical protein BMS3Bbin13_00160 [bacterium BMS3Bbin13]
MRGEHRPLHIEPAAAVVVAREHRHRLFRTIDARAPERRAGEDHAFAEHVLRARTDRARTHEPGATHAAKAHAGAMVGASVEGPVPVLVPDQAGNVTAIRPLAVAEDVGDLEAPVDVLVVVGIQAVDRRAVADHHAVGELPRAAPEPVERHQSLVAERPEAVDRGVDTAACNRDTASFRFRAEVAGRRIPAVPGGLRVHEPLQDELVGNAVEVDVGQHRNTLQALLRRARDLEQPQPEAHEFLQLIEGHGGIRDDRVIAP